MANNLGDFDASAVIYGKFTTTAAATGAPTTLAGTPALSVYKDNSVTQSTTGVTLTVDFDSVTGLQHFTIDTSADGTFYSAGSFFDVVITTGTVGGTSAVGYTVGQFTIRKTADLKPTIAGNTLDVAATGEAGMDWGNIANKTTVNAFTGTTFNVQIKKNQALAGFPFLMTDSTNHNPATGKTVTVTRSINGGAFGAGALSAVTEVGVGIYTVDFAAADLNGNTITLRATAASCDDLFVTLLPTP